MLEIATVCAAAACWWAFYVVWCYRGFYAKLKKDVSEEGHLSSLWPGPTKGFFRGSLPFAVGWTGITVVLVLPDATDKVVVQAIGFSSYGFMYLWISVLLFNWPGILVPPHLRKEPGMFQEWLQDRRKGSKE